MPQKKTQTAKSKQSKKQAKKPAEKKQTPAKKDTKRREAWGAVTPMPETQEEKATNEFCNQVAMLYGVPSMGVTILSNRPYLNKEGRLYLLHELRKGNKAVIGIETEFIQIPEDTEQSAIVKKIIRFKDDTFVEGVGEANKYSVKLDAVKRTPIMMAETRALNRAIGVAIAHDVWERVAKRAEMYDLTEDQKQQALEAGQVSAEEVNNQGEDLPQESPEEAWMKALRKKVQEIDDPAELEKIDKKVQESKIFSDDFKKEMHTEIMGKVDVINVDQ